jgi:tetratricopeptide (TPR) repeat protein
MKKKFIPLFASLFVLFFYSCSDKTKETPISAFKVEDSLTIEQYNNWSITLYNESKYDECIQVCKKAIQINPNNLNAYNVMCAVYSTQKNYQAAIEIRERSMLIDPQLTQIYDNLFYLYTTNKEWNKAEDISKKVLQINPQNANAQNNLNTLKANRKVVKFSKSITTSIISVLVLWLAFFIYKNKNEQSLNGKSSLEILLIGSSVSFLSVLRFHLVIQFKDTTRPIDSTCKGLYF